LIRFGHFGLWSFGTFVRLIFLPLELSGGNFFGCETRTYCTSRFRATGEGYKVSTRTRKKNGTWDENEIFLMMIIGCGCGYGLLKRQADKWTGRTPSSCKRRRRRTSKYNKVFVSHQQQQNVRNHGYIDHS
jgi:hypothetical protein